MRTLQALARDGGIADRVRFIGERNDVRDILQAADVYCQPNTEPEGFGLTFIEAMGAGLPVVTSGIGGAREIVNETCGILTEPGDAAGVASELRRLIGDDRLRMRLGIEGRKRADELCSPSTQMRRIQALLSGVVRSPRLDRAHTVSAE